MFVVMLAPAQVATETLNLLLIVLVLLLFAAAALVWIQMGRRPWPPDNRSAEVWQKDQTHGQMNIESASAPTDPIARSTAISTAVADE
jgi:hypothetical protein